METLIIRRRAIAESVLRASGLCKRGRPIYLSAVGTAEVTAEQTKLVRSSRQFSRFCYLINPDKVFGTHK